jgi:uncharacterized sulfatase
MDRAPDIVLIVSDDHRWCDTGATGNADVRTPNLDRLAVEGVCFDAHYTVTAMCAPARMALYSGVYPVRNGGWPNHGLSYPETRSIVHQLGALGYRVGLHGKRHFGPPAAYPFEAVDDVAGFVRRDAGQPYCLVIGTREPHAPWGRAGEDLYPPDQLHLAPNLIDTPASRTALARYYGAVARLDARIGEHLEHVESAGRIDDTLVIYTSDHGAQFPGGKWTCWEPGLRVPMLMRWPARLRAGTRTGALAQHVDILPTLVELAGGDPAAADTGLPGGPSGDRGFDGMSLVGTLLRGEPSPRETVYGVHTQHGTINGVPYPVRSVRDGRYKYIRNLNHEAAYQNALTGPPEERHENAYWRDWLDAARRDPHAAFLVDRYLHRPPEELYDLHEDPWELENRADDPALRGVRDALAERLDAWMAQQGDEGLATELRAPERQER